MHTMSMSTHDTPQHWPNGVLAVDQICKKELPHAIPAFALLTSQVPAGAWVPTGSKFERDGQMASKRDDTPAAKGSCV
jgi:hypothetical protein